MPRSGPAGGPLSAVEGRGAGLVAGAFEARDGGLYQGEAPPPESAVRSGPAGTGLARPGTAEGQGVYGRETYSDGGGYEGAALARWWYGGGETGDEMGDGELEVLRHGCG